MTLHYLIHSSQLLLCLLSAIFVIVRCEDTERFIILFRGDFGTSSPFFLKDTQDLAKEGALGPSRAPEPVFSLNFTNFTGLVYDVPRTPNVLVFSGVVDAMSNEIEMNPTVNQTNYPFNILMPQVGLPSELSFLIPILNSIFWIERSKQVSTLAIQTNAPWNLVRISEHMLRVPSIYRYLADGRGVDAYIIDSGIQSSNVDFKGHATTIADFTNSGLTDAYGHGTHVAGIVGSQTYGVAKSVNLLGVRVINSSGTSDWATVVAALSWVYNRVKMTKRPSVINMSLGGPISVALNAAISDLEALNVAVVAAAGNSRSDACMYSPSSSTSAIVVAASDYNNAWFAMSNFGSCVDMIAPGSYITSTFIGSNRSVAAMTGTSMAAPHVTGVVALLLSMNPTLTVSQLKLILTITCTNGIVSGIPIGRTPNRFLYSLATF